MIALLLACAPASEPVDLASPVPPGEVRAGVVTDPGALFGGISAEARPGDLMLVNDRVRFVIQGPRESGFYIQPAGGVLDADLVRPEGQVGRDLVDDWLPVIGINRHVGAVSALVIDDGRASGEARVRVEGPDHPIELITGALEAPDLVPPLGAWIRTDYVLEPDSWLVRVETTVTAGDTAFDYEPGDLLMASADATAPWIPGEGLAPSGDGPFDWRGLVADRNEAALAILAADGEPLGPGVAGSLLTSLAAMSVAYAPSVHLEPGESHTYARYYGLGPDLAALSAEQLARRGDPVQVAEGTVTAADGPVAGARVNVLLDGSPATLAVTGPDGTFSTEVPAGFSVDFVTDGRGPGVFTDLPPGAGSWSSYTPEPARSAVLESLAAGAEPIPLAEGRGAADGLTLGVPATLTLDAGDGLPFHARLTLLDPPPAVDPHLVRGRPSGGDAVAWSRDGDVDLVLEPGRYRVVAWRGVQWEMVDAEVEVAGDATLALAFSRAWEAPGWLAADPHSHAAPSGDGGCPMEDRLVVMAADGVQVHFGTDHDHAADYRPLVEPLGLAGVLASVLADEVSPVLRGHLNVYPLVEDPDAPNGGAWTWWSDPVTDTDEQMARLRSRHPGVRIQANHPLDSGLAAAAGWSEGHIAAPDFWSADFDAVEVLNSGSHAAYFPFFLDLENRGFDVVPVGVSDTHTRVSGDPGLNLTFLGTGGGLAEFDDDVLVATLDARRTVVSLGPMILADPTPGSTVTAPADLQVEVLAASWVLVDRLLLYENGQEVERVEPLPDGPVQFRLDPAADATYVVVAEGDQPMAPWFGESPWAMTAPIRVDVQGDGWDPPLPPLELAR